MTRLGSVAFAVAALSFPLCARADPPRPADFPGGHYVLDPRHASVIARVKHMGVSLYTLRFDTMDASFDYDPSHPEDTKLTAHVDPASLDVGADYSKEFATKFLGAGSFPTATFTSTRMTTAGDGTGAMTGDLTLMGVTKPVTFNVTFIGAGHEPLPIPLGRRAAGFEATATIKRSDFGSNYLLGMVGDEVTLQIEAEFEKK